MNDFIEKVAYGKRRVCSFFYPISLIVTSAGKGDGKTVVSDLHGKLIEI